MTATADDGTLPRPESPVAGDASGEERPLGGYLALTGTFAAALGSGLLAARLTGRKLDRPGTADVVLAGLATQKLARLLSKDKVTSFMRAPFTQLEGRAGHGELEERPRGKGLRYAIGELLLCPFCLAQWVSGGFAVGWALAPRPTRLLSAMWSAQAIADAAQLAYGTAERRARAAS